MARFNTRHFHRSNHIYCSNICSIHLYSVNGWVWLSNRVCTGKKRQSTSFPALPPSLHGFRPFSPNLALIAGTNQAGRKGWTNGAGNKGGRFGALARTRYWMLKMLIHTSCFQWSRNWWSPSPFVMWMERWPPFNKIMGKGHRIIEC